MAAFVVFSLPRSRSTWLSVFLSRPDAVCGHDIGMTLSSLSEFGARLRGDLVGTCETGAAFAWKLIRKQLPDARFVVIERDPIEVLSSLARFGVKGPDIEAEIWSRAGDLDEICADPTVLRYRFNDLTRPTVCGDIYAHCLGRPMTLDWWRALDGVNIQVDLRRNFETLANRAVPIADLKAQAREAMAHA